MKRILKKICSVMLCLTLIPGLFAQEGAALGTDTATSQIGGHFEADDATGELSDMPRLFEDTSKSYAGGRIKTDKTIAAGENENEFFITLEVGTKEEIQYNELSEDAAVVLVIDLSGSMKEGGRLEKAKQAALAFIEKFALSDGEKSLRKIAVVGFSGQQEISGWGSPRQKGIAAATTYQPWTDVGDASVISAINGMSAEGGTCLQAGLILANNLLNSSAVANISNRNIVVLTDGCPTYYLTDDAAKDTSEETVGAPQTIRGSGSNTDHDTHTKTESTARAILSSGVNVYSIFLGNDSVNCSGRGCGLRKTGADWLRQDCGFITYAVENAGDLSNIFGSISELIRLRAKAWIAEDPIAEQFDFVGFSDAPAAENEFYYDSTLKKVCWNLRLSTPEGDAEDGFSIYRLTYKVRLNTLAPGYMANRYYPTNGITSVTWLIEKSTESGASEIDSGIAYFNVPSAKGFAADIRFLKTDVKGQPLAGAKFGLYHKETLIASAASGSNGEVLFENVPSGHSYTVVEEAAPEGYIASTESYGIEVAFGNLLGTVGMDNTVVNLSVAKHGGLTVSKTVSGAGADNEDEFAFTVTLGDISITGTYGDLAFTDGVAHFTLKGGESVTASELPAGTGYTVTENDSKGYAVTVNGESRSSVGGEIEADKLTEIAFNNYKAGEMTPPSAGIDITKTVRATGDIIPDWENSFVFVVSKNLPSGSVEAEIVAMPFISITGTGTDSVACEFEGLDLSESGAVSFYIWEAPGYEPFWNYDPSLYRVTFAVNSETGEIGREYAKTADFGGEITFEPASDISFTNVYHYEDEPFIGTNGGDLVVSKTVSNGDMTKAFTFTVTLNDPEVNGIYGDMLFTDGVAVIQLKDGESATAEELPVNVGYTVIESDNDGYNVTVNVTDSAVAEGIITENETAFAAFRNEKIPDTGSVKVIKTVKGSKAPAESIPYSFRALLRDGDGNTVSESASYTLVRADGTDESGAAEIGSEGYMFDLKDGESITFGDIAEGRLFEVQEITEGDFTASVNGLSEGICTVLPNVTKEVEFVNDYGDSVPPPVITPEPPPPDTPSVITPEPPPPDIPPVSTPEPPAHNIPPEAAPDNPPDIPYNTAPEALPDTMHYISENPKTGVTLRIELRVILACLFLLGSIIAIHFKKRHASNIKKTEYLNEQEG